MQLSGGNAYHNLSLSGGNAVGYLYGYYPAFADGIHLGYNYYADSSGIGRVSNSGGATSRITAGYGFIGLYIGGVNGTPNTQRLYADSGGVTVNGTFNNNSDRNTKQDFTPVSASQILESVLLLPVSEWSYKDDPTTRHIGPMAQDFHATFQIGTDDRHIAPIDEGGLAFAAIQGLNAKVEARSQNAEDRIQELEMKNAELRGELDEIKSLLKSLNEKQSGRAK
ncbi:MAG: tail fiber domain-containing protein [Limisphaerales bacterium]